MAINRDLGYKPFVLCRGTVTARYGQRFVPKLSKEAESFKIMAILASNAGRK